MSFAWRVSRHGGIDALESIDVATPLPGPMQVRVRVEAVGLNHLDLWVRKGVEGHKFPLPLIPGCDVAGVIDAFGEGADQALAAESLKQGSAVVLNSGVSCGRCEQCLSGSDPLCRQYGILGEHRDGGCAEYIVVPCANVIARPASLTAVQAAALPIPFLTAWTMLVNKAQIRAGDLVLVQAGGSGVSIAAIQIAKLLGATVVTTVGADDKIAKAKTLGADHAIQYKKTPFRDEAKKIARSFGRSGYDIVIDHVGAETFSDSVKSLTWGGKLVTCGATSGSAVEVDLKAIFFKNISIMGSTMGSKGDFLRLVRLVAEGKLKPVVDSTFAMKDLRAAHAKLESREAFGKIVMTTG
jgi:NADPH:quinone reductase-like Zn-dependent oxidoreductase